MIKSVSIAKVLALPLAAIVPLIYGLNCAEAKVGVASVVNGEPLSKPPSQAERILNIGNDMLSDEVVSTKANDKAHIVFLDGSTLTVGPNSVVTIDKFVYDTETKNGAISINASRGVFRYVGGAISKNTEISVKTPSATLGIRGGIVTFIVVESSTTANFLYGKSLSVTNVGVTQITTQAGTQISAALGSAPTAPTAIQPGSIQQLDMLFQATNNEIHTEISTAIKHSNLGQANSNLSPIHAKRLISSAQHAQSTAHTVFTQGAGPQQAAGPLQSTSPYQDSGPLQDGSSEQSNAGPLQNSGPLAAATPFQETGPVQGAMTLSVSAAQPGIMLPTQEASLVTIATGAAAGSPESLKQLQSILSVPDATSPNTLSTLVNSLASASSTSSTDSAGFTSSTTLALSPTVYNSASSSYISPN